MLYVGSTPWGDVCIWLLCLTGSQIQNSFPTFFLFNCLKESLCEENPQEIEMSYLYFPICLKSYTCDLKKEKLHTIQIEKGDK